MIVVFLAIHRLVFDYVGTIKRIHQYAAEFRSNQWAFASFGSLGSVQEKDMSSHLVDCVCPCLVFSSFFVYRLESRFPSHVLEHCIAKASLSVEARKFYNSIGRSNRTTAVLQFRSFPLLGV